MVKTLSSYIDSRYHKHIITYQGFVSSVFEKIEDNVSFSSLVDELNSKKIVSKPMALEELRGSLIVVDEIQNLYNTQDINSFGYTLYHVMNHLGDQISVMGLSATPVTHISELKYFNLLFQDSIIYYINGIVLDKNLHHPRINYIGNRTVGPVILDVFTSFVKSTRTLLENCMTRTENKIFIFNYSVVGDTGIDAIKSILNSVGCYEYGTPVPSDAVCYKCHKVHHEETDHYFYPMCFITVIYDDLIQSQSNDEKIAYFNAKDDIKIILGGRILREGINLKNVDTVIITSIPYSLIDIYQIVGRCTRNIEETYKINVYLRCHGDNVVKYQKKYDEYLELEQFYKSLKSVSITNEVQFIQSLERNFLPLVGPEFELVELENIIRYNHILHVNDIKKYVTFNSSILGLKHLFYLLLILGREGKIIKLTNDFYCSPEFYSEFYDYKVTSMSSDLILYGEIEQLTSKSALDNILSDIRKVEYNQYHQIFIKYPKDVHLSVMKTLIKDHPNNRLLKYYQDVKVLTKNMEPVDYPYLWKWNSEKWTKQPITPYEISSLVKKPTLDYIGLITSNGEFKIRHKYLQLFSDKRKIHKWSNCHDKSRKDVQDYFQTLDLALTPGSKMIQCKTLLDFLINTSFENVSIWTHIDPY